jgi:hypothetical protein
VEFSQLEYVADAAELDFGNGDAVRGFHASSVAGGVVMLHNLLSLSADSNRLTSLPWTDSRITDALASSIVKGDAREEDARTKHTAYSHAVDFFFFRLIYGSSDILVYVYYYVAYDFCVDPHRVIVLSILAAAVICRTGVKKIRKSTTTSATRWIGHSFLTTPL